MPVTINTAVHCATTQACFAVTKLKQAENPLQNILLLLCSLSLPLGIFIIKNPLVLTWNRLPGQFKHNESDHKLTQTIKNMLLRVWRKNNCCWF